MSIQSQTERMESVKLVLLDEHPFFAYLIMRLRIREARSEELPLIPTTCVTPAGMFVFNPRHIVALNDSELKTELAHATLHVALKHLTRKPVGAKAKPWGIAIDVVTNAILVREGFVLPQSTRHPVKKDLSVNLLGTTHKNVDQLSAETLYRWLRKFMLETSGNGANGHGYGGHLFADVDDGSLTREKMEEATQDCVAGSTLAEERRNELEREWRSNMLDARDIARERGKFPASLEGLVDDSGDQKVDWRTALLRFVTKEMTVGWTWSRPHKKSFSLPGVYLPDVVREQLEVVCHVDSSGSTSDEELKMFFSELRGLIAAYTHIRITLIICDYEIQGEPYELDSCNWRTFIDSEKKLGRGGTSHKPVVDWVIANKPDAKVFITFTDGYSDMEEALPKLPQGCHRLILLTGDGARMKEFDKLGEVIRMD